MTVTARTGDLAFDRSGIRARTCELPVQRTPAELGARAFGLLLALVERQNRVVAKSEVLDVDWRGLAVEDGNLTVQVSALRKIPGPGSIATIPRVGRHEVCSARA